MSKLPHSRSYLTAIPLLALLAAALFGSGTFAEEEEKATEDPKFLFDTGNPPWRGELIALPPGFAPNLGWKGVEQIRFAPGMMNPKEKDFFSYVLVFLLEPKSDISEAALTRELLTYYRGLSRAVMGNKGKEVDTSAFTITLKKSDPAKIDTAPASAKEGVAAFSATLNWVEPFSTREAQTLHLEVLTWKHEGRPVVFSCVSPAAPDADAEMPWRILRAIRAKFRLE